MRSKINTILILIFSLLTLSLISAYIIEYGLGHKPCNLCLYQRYPYFISIFLILSILTVKKNIKIHLLLLSIVSIAGTALALYHFGIEQGFFRESGVCETQSLGQGLSKQEVLKELKENTISCKEVTFRFFGLSLASINAIFLFILSYIFFRLYKNYEIYR